MGLNGSYEYSEVPTVIYAPVASSEFTNSMLMPVSYKMLLCCHMGVPMIWDYSLGLLFNPSIKLVMHTGTSPEA